MPPPRTVARSLRRTATALGKIPDVAIAEIVEDVTTEAAVVGGEFTRRGYLLYAEARVTGGKNSRSAVVFGRPAGYWSIRTYGRGSMRVRDRRRGTGRLIGFRIGAGWRSSSARAGRARRGRWDEVVDYANQRAPDIVSTEVGRVVTRGQ